MPGCQSSSQGIGGHRRRLAQATPFWPPMATPDAKARLAARRDRLAGFRRVTVLIAESRYCTFAVLAEPDAAGSQSNADRIASDSDRFDDTPGRCFEAGDRAGAEACDPERARASRDPVRVARDADSRDDLVRRRVDASHGAVIAVRDPNRAGSERDCVGLAANADRGDRPVPGNVDAAHGS